MRKPINYFDDGDSLGIIRVPDEAKVVVKDYNGEVVEVLKIDDTGLTDTSTISDFLSDATLYKKLSVTASNGVTITDKDVQLGGDLTKDTTIDCKEKIFKIIDKDVNDDGSDLELKTDSYKLNLIKDSKNAGIFGNDTEVQIAAGDVDTYAEVRTNVKNGDPKSQLMTLTNNDETKIEILGTEITISGEDANFKGIEYASDYSTDFTDNSLVNKKYVDDSAGVSQLEKLDEGNGDGWRILGRNPDNYGDIGDNAIDLSYSDSNSTDNGATGKYAFTAGKGTIASGDYGSFALGLDTTASGGYGAFTSGRGTEAGGDSSFATGYYTKTSNHYAAVFGRYNFGYHNSIFEVGDGTSDSNRLNVFEIKDGGDVKAPESVAETNYTDLANVPKKLVTSELILPRTKTVNGDGDVEFDGFINHQTVLLDNDIQFDSSVSLISGTSGTLTIDQHTDQAYVVTSSTVLNLIGFVWSDLDTSENTKSILRWFCVEDDIAYIELIETGV